MPERDGELPRLMRQKEFGLEKYPRYRKTLYSKFLADQLHGELLKLQLEGLKIDGRICLGRAEPGQPADMPLPSNDCRRSIGSAVYGPKSMPQTEVVFTEQWTTYPSSGDIAAIAQKLLKSGGSFLSTLVLLNPQGLIVPQERGYIRCFNKGNIENRMTAISASHAAVYFFGMQTDNRINCIIHGPEKIF